MAQYDFGCLDCKMVNEFMRSIKIGPPVNPVCENCGSGNLIQFFYPVDVCVKVDDAVNLGHLANRNRDSMSQMEFAEKTYEHKLSSNKGRKELGIDRKGEAAKPWWRNGPVNTRLASMNEKQRKEYIEKGVKP